MVSSVTGVSSVGGTMVRKPQRLLYDKTISYTVQYLSNRGIASIFISRFLDQGLNRGGLYSNNPYTKTSHSNKLERSKEKLVLEYFNA